MIYQFVTLVCLFFSSYVEGAPQQQITADAFKYRVLYTQGYSRYKEGIPGCQEYAYTPADIDPFVATHILYGFFGVDPTTWEVVDIYDPAWSVEDLAAMRKLKDKNPQLRIQASVGGGAFTLDNPETVHIFIELMRGANGTVGTTFTKSLIKFARTNELDGIDIDWEWPEDEEQGQLFTNFIRVVWEAFHEEAKATGNTRLELSTVITSNAKKRNYPLAELTSYIDFGLLMTYEFRGAWSGFTEGHSPVLDCDNQENAGLSVSAALDFMLKNGADPTKLVMGVTSYGRTYQLAAPQENAGNFVATVGDGPPGECTQEPRNLAYYEIEAARVKYYSEIIEDVTTRMQASMTYGDSHEYWVGFDSPITLAAKICYAKANNLGGMFMWDQANDDHLALFTSLADNWDKPCKDYCPPSCTGDCPEPITILPGSGDFQNVAPAAGSPQDHGQMEAVTPPPAEPPILLERKGGPPPHGAPPAGAPISAPEPTPEGGILDMAPTRASTARAVPNGGEVASSPSELPPIRVPALEPAGGEASQAPLATFPKPADGGPAPSSFPSSGDSSSPAPAPTCEAGGSCSDDAFAPGPSEIPLGGSVATDSSSKKKGDGDDSSTRGVGVDVASAPGPSNSAIFGWGIPNFALIHCIAVFVGAFWFSSL